MKNHRYRDRSDKLLFFRILIVSILLLGIIYKYEFKSEVMQKLFQDIKADELFIQVMKFENHYFFPTYQSDFLSFKNISEGLLKIIINIKPSDTRSFLINEIPGLANYDTKIIVAGEGTDLTTLPFESPPPKNFIEKEVHDQFNNNTDKNDTDNTVVHESKSVFIYHTHNLESFLPLLKDATVPDEAFSSDSKANVVAVGEKLSNSLIALGIGVEHNKTNVNNELLKRKWDYSDSYKLSHEIVQTALANNKNIQYFIDIHRDSARKAVTTKNIKGKPFARLYFIVGKENKNYQKNLEFAKKINSELEKKYPGISRGVFLKNRYQGNGVYNQDVSDKAILVELGGVDNNIEELNNTIDALAEVFADYYWKENEATKQ
ncbi:stage II sporulation protein P [Bacillus sp. FJAT-49711]|uniref:stage II sporulation protein P n=1 Tax=Bacillus sp. FJAT-49711 TaxID=2833585 RepID=UPI001BC9167C|nr:stage II sporulation protein P [Bacillus sp. FJAT-49711]MBS4220320.1 stage II sporulation protein P [Bacillus sp. FJAT-49711]